MPCCTGVVVFGKVLAWDPEKNVVVDPFIDRANSLRLEQIDRCIGYVAINAR